MRDIRYQELTSHGGGRNRSRYYWIITVTLILLNIPLISFLFRFMQSAAFSMTCLPPMFAGWFLGSLSGAFAGATMGLSGFLLMIYLGVPLQQAVMTASLGTFLVTLAGVGFGQLHVLAYAAGREKQERVKAEGVQQRLAQQLQQSQKMEAIGTLAGGVAHDINNILCAIMASASLIENDIDNKNPHYDVIKDIITACRQGRDLTRNLLGFARKGKYVKEVIDVKDVVAYAKKLLERTINKRVQIETDFPDDILRIQGDRGQIDQAMMNICINGVQAMSGVGTLTITADSVNMGDPSTSGILSLNPGRYIRIAVADTGTGMDKETLSRVFEPFFTTKKPGQGTGLGLSMVYGAITNHGGRVFIDSELGSGTRVTVLIPAFEGELTPSAAPPEPSLYPGVGRILLVDDERLVRNSCARLLRRLGYEVLVAKNGSEAIELFRASVEAISVIILDLIMPEMDGSETFYKLKELDPNVKVLISSGYSKDEKVETLLTSGAVGFIQKPFDMAQLSFSLSKMNMS